MITIVGVGALGSHVALALRNMEQRIRVVDFDKVEMKNTQAQFHSTMSLGQNKALATAQSMLGLFGVNVEAFPRKLTEDNVDQLLKGSDIVIDCTDNIEARKLIRAYTLGADMPCLHGALSATGDFSRIMWTEHFVADAEDDEGATCEDGEALPFFMSTASFLAIQVQQFLKDGKKKSFQLTPGASLRVT